jgi:hypothetical protein
LLLQRCALASLQRLALAMYAPSLRGSELQMEDGQCCRELQPRQPSSAESE